MTTLRKDPTARPSSVIATINRAMAVSFLAAAAAVGQHADRYADTAVAVVVTEPPTLLW